MLTLRPCSFPFTEHETVSSLSLFLSSVAGPVVVVAIVALVFVPGSTVPPGTPKSLIWKRKLWELHTGWLGLALALAGQWVIISGMKNLFGKPRPDLLARCQPDLENVARYVVGGIANITSNGQLVSAAICTQTDRGKLDDGFRSYPSGHSGTSAGGLIYLSLFIASKFAIAFPFLAASGYGAVGSSSSFPSRLHPKAAMPDAYELVEQPTRPGDAIAAERLTSPADSAMAKRLAAHTRTVASVRLQAAAPPLYLLFICVLPFFTSIFISGSRWFDFRHHGFDILFGFLIGTTTAFFAFRYYHLPIREGAGWAWGPRSHDKAFWAGVGSYSYATAWDRYPRPGDEEEALGAHLPPAHNGLSSVDPPPTGARSRVGTDRTDRSAVPPSGRQKNSRVAAATEVTDDM